MATFGDGLELFSHRQAGRVGDQGVVFELQFQPAHADHHEFVQVRTGDRQELGPLQQRHRIVGRLFQHPLVELQPSELAVHEAVGRQAARDHATMVAAAPAFGGTGGGGFAGLDRLGRHTPSR